MASVFPSALSTGEDHMSWIKTVPFDEATGKLRKLYERVTGPDNNVDNIMMVHSFPRPRVLHSRARSFSDLPQRDQHSPP